MGLLIFLQVLLDLAFIAISTLLLIERFKSRTMEDPRLSRGLQLLSSKIAILQDLLDRTSSIEKHITQMTDAKQQEIQERIEEIETSLQNALKASHDLNSGTEVNSRGPSNAESAFASAPVVTERQSTLKYVQAAKLAHQGLSVEEIASQIDIPRGELELLVKVNRAQAQNTSRPEPVAPPATSTPVAAPSAPLSSGAQVLAQVQAASAVKFSLAHERMIERDNVRPVIFKKL